MYGKLLEHGVAPFDFDDTKPDNYFVKLRNRSETTTHWSVGYKDALESSNAEIGDTVKFNFEGKKPVKLKDGKTAHRSFFSVSIITSSAYTTPTNNFSVLDENDITDDDYEFSTRSRHTRSNSGSNSNSKSIKAIVNAVVFFGILAFWIGSGF